MLCSPYSLCTEKMVTVGKRKRLKTANANDRQYKCIALCIFGRSQIANNIFQSKSMTSIHLGLNAGLNAKYYSTGDAVTMECSLGVGSDGSVPSETAWYVTFFEYEYGV